MIAKVKICGLTRPEDVCAAIAHGADFLGFIVEAKSARKLTTAQAAKLALPAKGITQRVAVTVNADDLMLRRIMEHMQPDYIQCHGDETPERVADIGRSFGAKMIKAIAVETASDMKYAETFAGVCEFILYDAKPPKDQAIRGGHGLPFDWSVLCAAPLPKVWGLAGGLTPQTIEQAKAQTNAPIYDVSSGVEQAAGIKEASKIKAFIERAKGN